MENMLKEILAKLNSLDSKVSSIDSKVSSIDETQRLIQIQLREHGEILSALKTASEFHKADVDNLTHEVANISGDTKSIKNDIEKMSNDLAVVEVVTGKNMSDIATLKLVK